MSTRLYPLLPPTQIHALEAHNTRLDRRWLIDQVISPELPNVLDTLTRCLEMITDGTEVKLPLTSTRTEQVKGVLTRAGNEIVALDMTLTLTSFSKRLRLKMKDNSHLELVQWTELIHLVNEARGAVIMLQQQQHYDDDDDTDVFLQGLQALVVTLGKCNTVLNKPQQSLQFPQHKTDLESVFESDAKLLSHYKERLAMDFFLSNSEIELELKSLALVTEEPWCHVDTKGQSHVDKLRDDLKHHRIQLNDILESEKRTLGHVLGFSKFSTRDYFERGVTFDGRVVIEVEKLSIRCQDPTLLSVGAKLNGLEHLVSKMFSNLDLATMAL